MYFKQVLDERCGCASYIIASRQSHEAAIVDPAIDIAPYESLLVGDVGRPLAAGALPGELAGAAR